MTETAKKVDILSYPGVDWNVCLELTANNESLAKDLLKMFVDSLPGELELLQTAHAESDIQALKNQAHKIHGALCYCGIPSMKEAILFLEKACLENVNQGADNQAEIDTAYQSVCDEIQQLLDFVG